MFGCWYNGYVSVTSGKSNGRSFHDLLKSGMLTMTGKDSDGKSFKRIVKFEDGEIQDNRLIIEGKTVHRIVYGKFETLQGKNGREIVRFYKGGKSKHGKARRSEKLFGATGVCHSWYKRGRLVRQKFIYSNGKTAYDWNAFRNQCTVKDPEGMLLYEISGALDGRDNCIGGSHSVLNKRMEYWFLERLPFEVKKHGKVVYAGAMEKRQRVGRWVLNGKAVHFVHGVAIPAKLYNTPDDKLDPLKILKNPNAQVRMALMSRIDPERIAKCGRVIHSQGDMRLFDIKDFDVRILRVRCTTTKSYYFLRVPKDSTKCEQARQWTFGVGDDFSKPIKFAKET